MALEVPYRSIPDMFLQRVTATPNGKAFAIPTADDTGITWLTWAQVGARAKAIAAGLRELGVGLEDRVSILSGTRLEWVLADIGLADRLSPEDARDLVSTIVLPAFGIAPPGPGDQPGGQTAAADQDRDRHPCDRQDSSSSQAGDQADEGEGTCRQPHAELVVDHAHHLEPGRVVHGPHRQRLAEGMGIVLKRHGAEAAGQPGSQRRRCPVAGAGHRLLPHPFPEGDGRQRIRYTIIRDPTGSRTMLRPPAAPRLIRWRRGAAMPDWPPPSAVRCG